MALEATLHSEDHRHSLHGESPNDAFQNGEKSLAEKSIEEGAFDTNLDQAEARDEAAQAEVVEFEFAYE